MPAGKDLKKFPSQRPKITNSGLSGKCLIDEALANDRAEIVEDLSPCRSGSTKRTADKAINAGNDGGQ